MTETISPARETDAPTVLRGRPSPEGANIRTWIGFKHFVYLVEQAVLQWLIDRGAGAGTLFHEHGLGVRITDCSVQLPAVLLLDDEVDARVAARDDGRLDVRLTAVRDGAEVTVLRGKVAFALVRERTADRYRPAPPALARWEVAEPVEPEPLAVAAGEPVEAVLATEPGSYLWSWRAPYFYCHYSDTVQHSGFVRALEEVVDRFLADRGISVGRLLRERSWIPVVSRVALRLHAPARMEETIHTVFTVREIMRGVMFDARMDCHVLRDGALVPVATARILHGYAIAAGEGAGTLAELDDGVVRALLGDRP
ncbi:thioesterase family protein [Actinomadura sediminis]|uniref:Thioesterase family protein n=1 Tax=Actinomadura sediminis TaxID=1038904 RepID=A0ABW3EKJ3_9ACTN